MKKFRLERVQWNAPALSSSLGLEKKIPLQSKSMDFDPTETSKYQDVVNLSKARGLSQRAAVIEWARLHPERIPAFIFQMKRDLKFRGWFKPYYDTLRFMYKRLTTEDAPRIPDLDISLESEFRKQSAMEKEKLKAVTVELHERSLRVEWFEDAELHFEMMDRGRLLHRLPQLSTRRGAKRGRSRSRSKPRTSRPIPEPAKVLAIADMEPGPSGVTPTVAVIELPDNKDLSGDDSDSADTTLSGDMHDIPKDSSNTIPRSEKVIIRHGAGPLPEVVVRRAGKEVVISYDEYLNRAFTKDSSSDEEFIIETPTDLLDSLKA